jgi:long-chain fatty acid transport protein
MSGPIAQLPGSSVREDVQVDSIIAGLNIQFGGKRKARSLPSPDAVAQAAVAPADPAVQTAAAPADSNEPPGR